jgi:hypothetical protein
MRQRILGNKFALTNVATSEIVTLDQGYDFPVSICLVLILGEERRSVMPEF